MRNFDLLFSFAEGGSANCICFTVQMNAVKSFNLYLYFEEKTETSFLDLFIITFFFCVELYYWEIFLFLSRVYSKHRKNALVTSSLLQANLPIANFLFMIFYPLTLLYQGYWFSCCCVKIYVNGVEDLALVGYLDQ